MTRHRFAVLLLLTIPLASSLWYLLDVVAAYSRGSKPTDMTVVRFDDRFALLHKAMPARSVLGYISDNPANDTESQAEFYLTQYALAPAIIKATSEEHFVVANFHFNNTDQAKLRAKNLVRVQDFGNDVFIYRNTTK